jgi:transposase
VAFSYIECDRDQQFLLPPSMWDWLPEGHLAFFVIDAVGVIDTSSFHFTHLDGPGRPAYDPDMMLTLLLYAYCIGVRSSRAIEKSCLYDLAFRVIAANKVPDHGTIARFRADNEEAIKTVFIEVLRLCHLAGLASLGQIAIDGTKIGADAALDANRSLESIRAEIARILAEAADADRAELGGDGDGFVLPDHLARRNSRLAHLQAARIQAEAQEEAAAKKIEDERERALAEAAAGRRLRGRKPCRPDEALVRAEADHLAAKVKADRRPRDPEAAQALVDAEANLATARERAESEPPADLEVNVTDPDSAIMKTKAGWTQGYNVQAAVNADQVVVAYAATTDHNDSNQLLPMIEATEKTAADAGIAEQIGLVLADAGYWSEDNATADGPNRLIATTKDWKQRKAAREMGTTTGPPPEDASALEQMEHRLRTAEGAAAYATRSHTVEPPFGNLKENRGFRRFMRRGIRAVESETALIFATHNLMKVFFYNPSAVFESG